MIVMLSSCLALKRRMASGVLSLALSRGISSEEHHEVDWTSPALKYLRYIGVDIPNSIRLYKRFGKTKYFTRDNVADLVDFFDLLGIRGNAVKDAIICAPDLLRVPTETLEARACWYRDVFDFSHQELRVTMELYPNLLEDRATQRFEEGLRYFKELGLTRDEFRQIVLRCPTILHNSVHDSVAKTMDFFLERDVEKSELLKAIVQFPELLNYSLMGHILPKAHFFQTELKISQSHFAQVFVKHPWVLGLNLESEIRHTVQWLMDFGASKEALADVVLKFPTILGYSVENNFKPKLDYFVHYLGMPFGEVAKIIEQQPGFVGASLKEHIRPFVWCMEHELSMPLPDIQQVFIKEPALFGLAFGEVLKPTIDYFIHDLGCRRDLLGRMLTVFPQMLCYSLEDNIKPRIQWLKETVGIPADKIPSVALHRIYQYSLSTLNNKLQFVRTQLDIDHTQMAVMVCEDASMLHKSLVNLAKKIQFLESEMKRERKEIVNCPQFLGFSLESRLQLRHSFLQSLKRDTSSHSLTEIFASPDSTFLKSIAKTKERRFDSFKESYLKDQASRGDSDEDEKAEEALLEQTFMQEQSLAPIEEVREAERRFARNFKYQTVLE